MVITFILTLVLWQQGNFNTLLVTDTAVSGETLPWAAQFILPWIPSFGIKFHLAMDGLSLLDDCVDGISWHYGGGLLMGRNSAPCGIFFILTYCGR